MLVNLTNLERLIAILKDGKWHSSDELANKVSWRFGHTVFEARKKGYSIEKRKVAHNRFEYRMLAA
jgi:biotin operon repressor